MSFVLHVISDRARHHLPLQDALLESALGGADVLQVRDKKAPAGDIASFVRTLKQRLDEHRLRTEILVNDRVDVSMATSVRGVHLAAKSLPVEDVHFIRCKHGWGGLIGISVHSLEEALAAEASGANYVTFGHIYESESHPGLPPRGISQLARIVSSISLPVIAIGGITRENLHPVLDTGCSGIAVIGAVLGHPQPRATTETLKELMTRSQAAPKVLFPLHGEVLK